MSTSFPYRLGLLLWYFSVFAGVPFVHAQNACPPNIDFEFGDFTNWTLYTGINPNSGYATTVGPIPMTLSGPISGRHTIVSGTGTDPWGNFPVVAPGGGLYSMKLGNASTGAQMEEARYIINVPIGMNNYSLVYRYAIVLENPLHVAAQQPFFRVRAYNAVTGIPVNCATFIYISSSSLPGFVLSPGTDVYYKSWSTASLNLSGQAGQSIVVV